MLGRSTNVAALQTDADVAAWVAAVIAAGGSVSATQQAYVTTLVQALKGCGGWALMDRVWLFAAENATQATIDLVVRASATNHSASFTTNRGFLGNANSAYLDLGVPPWALARFMQNSAHIGIYVRDGDGATNLWVGSRDIGSGYSSDVTIGAGATGSFQLQAAGTSISFDQGAQNGMHIFDRIDSNEGVVSNNGVDTITQNVGASSSRSITNLTVLARNSSGTLGQYSGSRVAALSIGSSLGISGRANLTSAVNAYMTSVGANVF